MNYLAVNKSELVELINQGRSDLEIALELFTSQYTIWKARKYYGLESGYTHREKKPKRPTKKAIKKLDALAENMDDEQKVIFKRLQKYRTTELSIGYTGFMGVTLTCPCCEKRFYVSLPDDWVYQMPIWEKRKVYFCSYSCFGKAKSIHKIISPTKYKEDHKSQWR